jgi:hypothetical protein
MNRRGKGSIESLEAKITLSTKSHITVGVARSIEEEIFLRMKKDKKMREREGERREKEREFCLEGIREVFTGN